MPVTQLHQHLSLTYKMESLKYVRKQKCQQKNTWDAVKCKCRLNWWKVWLQTGQISTWALLLWSHALVIEVLSSFDCLTKIWKAFHEKNTIYFAPKTVYTFGTDASQMTHVQAVSSIGTIAHMAFTFVDDKLFTSSNFWKCSWAHALISRRELRPFLM